MPFDNRQMARVVLDHLSKAFRSPKGETIRAVEDAGFTVEDGELFVLLGPSGCGKTTTLRLIAGLEEVTAGTISIDGQLVNGVAPKERDVAMVFQNYALYPHMSVVENLAFGMKVRKFSKAEINRRVAEACELLGLDDCLERKPEDLSGGQRQRVALGRALVLRPGLFLFDEPLSNLDPQLRAQLRGELARLHARLGATMIYVTHDQVEALTLGNRIGVMRDGVIQQVAEPMVLYREPANLFVAGFIGSPPMNFFRGSLAREAHRLVFRQRAAHDASAGDGFIIPLEQRPTQSLDAFVGKQVILGLRAEDIRIHLKGLETPGDGPLEAQVQAVQPLGSETHVYLTCGGEPFIARAALTEYPGVAQRLSLSFDMSKARFFDAATAKAIA
jgi:multiple sugar transport system ATP-binding protein